MTCSKLPFSTKAAAKRARRRVAKAGGQRIYRCDKCGQFHFTSIRKSEWRDGEWNR